MSTTTATQCTSAMNTWPEYPPIRYWHDLTYQPSKRPFYAFVHANIVVTPRIPSYRYTKPEIQGAGACSEWERQWYQTQEYWWSLNCVDPEDGSQDQGKDMPLQGEEETPWADNNENRREALVEDFGRTVTDQLDNSAMGAINIGSRMTETRNLADVLLRVLELVSVIGFCWSISVTIGSALFVLIDGFILQRFGKLRVVPARTPSVWFENVLHFRSWAVAPPLDTINTCSMEGVRQLWSPT